MRAPSTDRLGHAAESRAAWWLRLKGFRILARRYRTPVGEIDLVACRGRLLVFVEVKLRKTPEEALLSLRPRQRARIQRSAEHWLQRHGQTPDTLCRFDVVAIAPGYWPRHLPDAWRG